MVNQTKLSDAKQSWKASNPYPIWPFSNVPPKELQKYVKLQAKEDLKNTEPGLF